MHLQLPRPADLGSDPGSSTGGRGAVGGSLSVKGGIVAEPCQGVEATRWASGPGAAPGAQPARGPCFLASLAHCTPGVEGMYLEDLGMLGRGP